MGRSVNKGYSLKQAMKDAKKIYRKGKRVTAKKYRRSSKKSGYGRRRTRGRRYRGGITIPKIMGGDQEEEEQEEEEDEVKGGTHPPGPKVMGGKNDDDNEDEK
jgi:hypothetical protein